MCALPPPRQFICCHLRENGHPDPILSVRQCLVIFRNFVLIPTYRFSVGIFISSVFLLFEPSLPPDPILSVRQCLALFGQDATAIQTFGTSCPYQGIEPWTFLSALGFGRFDKICLK